MSSQPSILIGRSAFFLGWYKTVFHRNPSVLLLPSPSSFHIRSSQMRPQRHREWRRNGVTLASSLAGRLTSLLRVLRPRAALPVRPPGCHCGAVAPRTLRSSNGDGPGPPRVYGHLPRLGALSWRCTAPLSGHWAGALSWRWARTGECRRRWRSSLQWPSATSCWAVGPRASTTMSYGDSVSEKSLSFTLGFGCWPDLVKLMDCLGILNV